MESNSTAFLIKKNCATALAGHRAAILFNRDLQRSVIVYFVGRVVGNVVPFKLDR